MKCTDSFYETYNYAPQGISFCPYRVCPIGAHSDHQHGRVTGFAINKGIHIAYSEKKNGVIEMTSLNFPKRAQFHIEKTPTIKQNDWADYLRGATIALNRQFPLSVGLCGVIEGGLPIGGLSSSAALIIAFLSALCRVNGIILTAQEVVEVALEAENKYVGVSCGKLDQSCMVYAKSEHLLYLDISNNSYELIPQQKDMKPYEIVIFFSGIERTLVGSKYNMRVDECKSAAYALMAFEGMEYGKFENTYLRDVPVEIFDRHKNKLPASWSKRAQHWYTEFSRVGKGADAWRKGDIESFGKLIFASGQSSINDYETGSPELIKLYSIMKETDGIYGGRFSGAGFRGCCMALIDPSYKEHIQQMVTAKYTKAFPALSDKFLIYFCHSGNGVNLL